MTLWKRPVLTYKKTGEEIEVLATIDVRVDDIHEITERIPPKVKKNLEELQEKESANLSVAMPNIMRIDDEILATFDIIKEIEDEIE